MKSNNISKFLYVLIIIIFICSCKKDEEGLGIGVLPGGDKINVVFSDTSSVLTYTEKIDSVISTSFYGLSGYIEDPAFGKTEAGFVVQFGLPSNNLKFANTTPTLDSITISLNYNGYYGDTSIPQTIKVFRVIEDINNDSNYYSNYDIQYDPTELATFTITPSKKSDTISIKLNDLFGEEILQSDISTLADDAGFLNSFKGFYFKPDPLVNGAILFFDVKKSSSKLNLYYKDTDSLEIEKDTVITFPINNSCNTFNLFKHDYSGTDIQLQLNDASSDSIIYLQSMAGVKTKITLPNIKDWFTDNNKIFVNKAELVIPVFDDNNLDLFPPPGSLDLYAITDSLGSTTYLKDISYGSNYFGGTYNSSEKTYTFNIAVQIQKILEGDADNFGFTLFIPNSVNTANRVIIRGGTNSNGMKLNLTYTKL